MRPTFQEQPWFESDGLGEDELLIRFCLIDDLENLFILFFLVTER
jgi:hypothetical protein